MARPASTENSPDTRDRILQAALQAFAENGYDGATMRSIAASADVNLGLLQYYFGGKPKLWRAAVDSAFAEIRSGVDAILENPGLKSGADKTRELIHAYARFAARKPEFVRLMHEEGKRKGPRMRWLVDRHVRPFFDAIAPHVERMRDEGVIPTDIDPIHFTYAMVGSIDTFFHQAEECKRMTGIDPADPEVADAHARAVCHLFLRDR